MPLARTLILLIGTLPLFLAACSKPPEQPVETMTAPAPVPAAELLQATFIGAEVCADCHPDQLAAWQGSHHDLAMQHATADTVLGDFADTSVEYFDTVTRFAIRDGEYWVQTQDGSGEQQDYRVDYTFGVEPLQQYLVELENGYIQTLPFAWDTENDRWFHVYGDDYIAADDQLHWTRRDQNWNYMCAECHSTNLQKHYSVQENSYATTWSEINVSCEACHGPGSNHVEFARMGTLLQDSGLQVSLNDRNGASWTMNPHTGIAERQPAAMSITQQPEACGRCHSRRGVAAADYEFGKPLLDSHVLSLLDDPLYFADGQIREEVYVYGSFVQSKMYRSGVTCSDCHDPHTAELKADGPVSTICSSCHSPEKFASAEHHRHPQEAVECVDCHMASRNYMVVDPRRDHSFRIPRPDLTDVIGSPNACNSCHEDQTSAWAAAHVVDWYGEPPKAAAALAIHAGRTGAADANSQLLAVVADSAKAGIVRATALTLLRPPYSRPEAEQLRASLAEADALIRIGALRTMQGMPPEAQVEWAAPLLRDPVLTVRLAAVDLLSAVRQMIGAADQQAFLSAEREYRDSQLAVAERPEALGNIANMLAQGGQSQQAEAYYTRALQMDPSLPMVRGNLADFYRAMGREEDAERVIRDGIELNETDAVLHHILGLLLVRTGRTDEALPELQKAMELQPQDARLTYVYAIALHSTGRSQDALNALTEAQQRLPASFDIDYAIVTMLADMGQLDAARAAAVDLNGRYPGDPNALALLKSLEPQ